MMSNMFGLFLLLVLCNLNILGNVNTFATGQQIDAIIASDFILLTSEDSIIPSKEILVPFAGENFIVSTTLSFPLLPDDAQVVNEFEYEFTLNGVKLGRKIGTIDQPTLNELLVTSSSGSTEVTLNVYYTLESPNFEATPMQGDLGSKVFQVIKPGVSIIPLVFVLVFAFATQMVELSLFLGIFIGACIVAGSVANGFFDTLSVYILDAVSDSSHQQVILFTLFTSGLVGMMEKSGGIDGLGSFLKRYAKTRHLGQLIAVIAGALVFFDDYASCLVAGFSMRPLLDVLYVSREKLAFIVDATSAPIASLSPISAWVGFELQQIQEQLDSIKRINNDEIPQGLSSSSFLVFIDTLPYRFYPWFMLIFQVAIIAFKREFGPMLTAERKVVVNERIDGGDGAFQREVRTTATLPLPGTPRKAWNMIVPVILLSLFIILELVRTGREAFDGSSPTAIQIFELSDPFLALLTGSFAASLISLFFYFFQFKKDGKLVWPTPRALITGPEKTVEHVDTFNEDDDLTEGDIEEQTKVPITRTVSTKGSKSGFVADGKTRSLLNFAEGINSWLSGSITVLPAVYVLVLAWATGAVLDTCGANRFLSGAIKDGVPVRLMPTITFVISAITSLATGTSWGTMRIVFPIVTTAAYTALIEQDPNTTDFTIVIGVLGAVLSGAVAGDHCSPISDTTVLSSIASGCDLMAHVWTQLPYAITVFLISILIGTLPNGYSYANGYPAWVGIIVGFPTICLVVFLLGAPVVAKNGKFDPLTELYLLVRRALKLPSEEHEFLRQKTQKFAKTGGSDKDYEGSIDESSSASQPAGYNASSEAKDKNAWNRFFGATFSCLSYS